MMRITDKPRGFAEPREDVTQMLASPVAETVERVVESGWMPAQASHTGIFSEDEAMSQTQPDSQQRLEVDVVSAIVQQTSFGDSKTSILFSITDQEWRALYTFQEMISAVSQQ